MDFGAKLGDKLGYTKSPEWHFYRLPVPIFRRSVVSKE